MQTRGKIYEDFFRSRGVSEEKIQNLMRYISSIYEARLELQFSTSQLTRIRNDYGRELNIALGPLVSDYQLTEMDSKAQVEMTQLNAFLKQRHFDLEPAEASVISKLIRDHGAYTYMTTVDVGGVFDDWRPASSGGEAAAVYSVYAEDLRDKSTVLLTAAEKENLSANAQKILHEYYAAGVDYYAQVVRKNEASRVPDPERRVPLRLRANAAAEDARLEKLARPR